MSKITKIFLIIVTLIIVSGSIYLIFFNEGKNNCCPFPPDDIQELSDEIID